MVGEVIAVATPPLSMSSSVFCTDQFASGGLVRPMMSMASSQVGGDNVMMDVDAMRLGLRQDLRGINTAGPGRERRGATREDLTAVDARCGKRLDAASANRSQTASDR